jgi:hypothetical protein
MSDDVGLAREAPVGLRSVQCMALRFMTSQRGAAPFVVGSVWFVGQLRTR